MWFSLAAQNAAEILTLFMFSRVEDGVDMRGLSFTKQLQLLLDLCNTGKQRLWHFCRQELERQQPVRTGCLQKVVKFRISRTKDWGFGTWVPGLRHQHSCSYFLTHQLDGGLLLHDADGTGRQPRQLQLKLTSFSYMTAFTGKDRSLHVLWAADEAPHRLYWDKIDPSTGHSQSLLGARNLFCHWQNYQAMVHLASGQVLACKTRTQLASWMLTQLKSAAR